MNAAPPTRVAVVGSGPSGFYAAEALLKSDAELRVDMFERLPTPFGLVRGGVAPDHPKIKQVALVYDRIACLPRFRFLGNVAVGRDVAVSELREAYHAVVLAHGADAEAPLGVPGESLPGSFAAGMFVGWYNGHPDHSGRTFDLSHPVAVVIGQGNVAADLVRMLATPAEALARTDIADYAAEALARSGVREICVVGRRGPAQARFTNNELRELGEIPGCDPVVDAADLVLNEASERELANLRAEVAAKNVTLLREFAARPSTQPRRCRFRFLEAPVRIEGDGHVQRIVLARTRLEGPPFGQAAVLTEETVKIDCGLVLRSVGFRGTPLENVPFDPSRGVILNQRGRVLAQGSGPVAGLYVTGWIKRGATGVIGTNRADSAETAQALLEDLPSLRVRPLPPPEWLAERLSVRGVRAVDYEHWLKLDRLEVDRGRPKGKPREKVTSIPHMLDLA